MNNLASGNVIAASGPYAWKNIKDNLGINWTGGNFTDYDLVNTWGPCQWSIDSFGIVRLKGLMKWIQGVTFAGQSAITISNTNLLPLVVSGAGQNVAMFPLYWEGPSSTFGVARFDLNTGGNSQIVCTTEGLHANPPGPPANWAGSYIPLNSIWWQAAHL